MFRSFRFLPGPITKGAKFKWIKWWYLPLLAVIVYGLTQIFSRTPGFVEQFYSQKFYPLIAFSISFFSSWFPFSLGDLFYLFLAFCGIIIFILFFIRKISFKTSGKLVLNIFATVYVLFYLLWGFNYYRIGLNNRLGLSEQKADTEEFMSVFIHIAEQTNDSYCTYENFDKTEINRLIEYSYKKLAPVLQLEYTSGTRIPKNMTLNTLFSMAGIAGYYGPFFNEVHVNTNNLPLEYPFVLAHEKAHQFGIAAESEANFYAWLVCSQSESKYLQYSANLIVFRYFMHHGSHLDEFPEILARLDMRVIKDLRKMNDHWAGLRIEKIEKAATKVNDAYLKTNNLKRGVKDYSGVVKHVMDYSTDSLFQRKLEL